jgi:hypothetical protein
MTPFQFRNYKDSMNEEYEMEISTEDTYDNEHINTLA